MPHQTTQWTTVVLGRANTNQTKKRLYIEAVFSDPILVKVKSQYKILRPNRISRVVSTGN